MGEYAAEDWYIETKNHWVSDYGEIPPPWVFRERGHPLQIGWRMGAGETFLMVYWEWWEEENKSEKEMLDYFKKYDPPPRWLGWVCEIIWNPELDSEEDGDYSIYLDRLKSQGFEGTELYKSDFEDPQWIEQY